MIKIYTQTFGQGQPLVLVHGWAMHTGIWRKFAEQLGQFYQVTCIDLPGHGFSEALDTFTLERVSAELINAVTESQSCWLGWSLGASVVLDIAQRFPERVSSLILLAGNPLFPQTELWPGMKVDLLEAFGEQLREDCRATLLRFLSLQVTYAPDQKSLLRTLKAAVLACDSPNPVTLQGGLEILKRTDLRSVLVETKVPVSVILGTRDTLVPVRVGQELLALAPEIKLSIIDKAGHVPFLSHPQDLLEIITDFMDGQCT